MVAHTPPPPMQMQKYCDRLSFSRITQSKVKLGGNLTNIKVTPRRVFSFCIDQEIHFTNGEPEYYPPSFDENVENELISN